MLTDPDSRPIPLVIAHRGASLAHRENTIEAFAAAGALGADAVELDVRRTADGAVIVHHDAHLPDGRVIVELAAVDLPTHVPSLAEALDACGDLIVNIEIKNWPEDPDFDPGEAVADEVVALLAGQSRHERILVSCFHRPTIDRVRTAEPRLATAFLHARADMAAAASEAVEHGHGSIHPWDRLVTAEGVAAAHARGLRVNVWTVDDPDRMATLAAWSVDGIVTNIPDVARRVVSATR